MRILPFYGWACGIEMDRLWVEMRRDEVCVK